MVDVFTETRFEGNQLGCFPDASGLSLDEMQVLARELNLAETAFVLPPEASGAARVRIFTPVKEMEFAGHPTIGTAYALCALGRVPANVPSFVLEENIGPVSVRVERRADPFLGWLRTPPISFGAEHDREAVAQALGLATPDLVTDVPVQVVTAGNPFLFVALREPALVDRAQLDVRALERAAPGFAANGVFVFAPTKGGAYSRMFAPMSGIAEDPATGSATGPLFAFMAAHGLVEPRDGARYVSQQGTKMQRRSFIHGLFHLRDGAIDFIEIGGSAIRVIDATVTL